MSKENSFDEESFKAGAKSFFDCLSAAAANNYHEDPIIGSEKDNENRIVMKFAEDALECCIPEYFVKWMDITELYEKIRVLESEIKELRKKNSLHGN